MAPRAYRMTRRAAANAETRRRIVDAAITLHAEKGVLGTSWPDIAKRADVALGTVYRHFPTLDQLVPACTSENAVRMKPPGVGILVGLTRPEERIGRFVGELFAFYGRSAPWTPQGRRRPAATPNSRHNTQPSRSRAESSRGRDAWAAPTSASRAGCGAGPYRLRRLAVANPFGAFDTGRRPPYHRDPHHLVEPT